jgi:hypothetical protein
MKWRIVEMVEKCMQIFGVPNFCPLLLFIDACFTLRDTIVLVKSKWNHKESWSPKQCNMTYWLRRFGSAAISSSKEHEGISVLDAGLTGSKLWIEPMSSPAKNSSHSQN